MEKHMLRKTIRDLRRVMPGEKKIRANNAITQTVCSLPEIQKAKTISLYVSLPEEVSTEAIREYCLAMGKNIAIPKVVAGNLEFYKVTKDSDLEPGIFGLLEPKMTCPSIDTKAIDVFLLPGLAFDRKGNRLGWGKGYYDRALSTTRAIKIGLAYACQLIPVVPITKEDRSMDCIVTDLEVIRILP